MVLYDHEMISMYEPFYSLIASRNKLTDLTHWAAVSFCPMIGSLLLVLHTSSIVNIDLHEIQNHKTI